MKIQVLVITLFILLLTPFAFAQNLNGVQLNDGTLIYGDVYVSSQNSKWINIKKKDGSIETIRRDDVLKFLNNENGNLKIGSYLGTESQTNDRSFSTFDQDTKFYLGVGYGFSDVDTGISNLTGTASLDEEDSGFKVFGGYQINSFFGIEVAYVDFGQAELKGNSGDSFVFGGITFTSTVTGSITAEAKTFAIGTVLSLPLEEMSGNDALKYITPFIKLGVHFWDIEYTASASGIGSISGDDDGTDVVFGTGLNINLMENLSLRCEWERFNCEEDIDYFSGSIIVKF